MPSDAALIATNQAFYDAFRDHDLAAMEAIWSQRAEVACIHPGWPVLCGRDRVLASWRGTFAEGDGFDVRCASPMAYELGAHAAFVTCIEVLPETHLVATNVFVREDGAWRLVHHQAGPAQAVPVPPPDHTWN